jgi:hypothetical protein
MHPMVVIDDEAHVEAHFGLFGDSANLETKMGALFTSNVP